MSELFERVTPAQPLEWTGERLTTDAIGQVEVEHLHRYFLARHLARDLDVLDIASGEGYGSALLAQTARSVVGVEVDLRAVEHARISYVARNLRFEQGSAQAIPLEDQSVDVVVSFETIEHFYEQEKFISEVRRVLRPSGVFVVSSPNRDVYSGSSNMSNPYHVRELSRSEFEVALRNNFSHVRFLCQRPIIGSVIVREIGSETRSESLTFERRGNDRFESSTGFDRPLYYLSIASNSDFPLLPDSFYFERGGVDDVVVTLPALRATLADRDGQIEQLQARVAQYDHVVVTSAATFQETLTERDGQISQLIARVARYESDLSEARSSAAELAARLQETKADIARTENDRSLSEDKLRDFSEVLERFGEAIVERERRSERLRERFGNAMVESDRRSAQLQGALSSAGERLQEYSRLLQRFEEALVQRDAHIERLKSDLGLAIAKGQVLAKRLRNLEGAVLQKDVRLSGLEDAVAQAGDFITDVSRLYADLKRARKNKKRKKRFFGFRRARPAVALPASVSREDFDAVDNSVFFDARFYLAENPEVLAARIDPALHYLEHGGREGRDPGPFFSTAAYLAENPEVAASRMNALAHYERYGRDDGKSFRPPRLFFAETTPQVDSTGSVDDDSAAPDDFTRASSIDDVDAAVIEHSPFFDRQWYLATYSDVGFSGVDPALHYFETGGGEGRDPGPFFSTTKYLADNPKVAAANLNALAHYESQGRREAGPIRTLQSLFGGRASQPDLERNAVTLAEALATPPSANEADLDAIELSPFFDRQWYLATYRDVGRARIDAALHYLETGGREGRDPGPFFSTTEYLRDNPDVAVAQGNALAHYERYGRSQGRPIPTSHALFRRHDRQRGSKLMADLVAPESIVLPTLADGAVPDVSVVILSYGQVDYSLRCLSSIAKHPPRSSVEVIVSDDCSHARDLDKLARVPHLRFLQPPTNLGFLKHANWAAGQTRGKYILLLNNDTEIKSGAIDALVETVRAIPNVGLVGSKLIYPDGTLQEAGGIIWNDGSAWNYGRLDDPNKPEYNYVRDADYISGASILVPRSVWDQLSGFDEEFAPAYCEDSDFAFRVRQSGLRVLYQPESVVVHYEGVSHGTDLGSGIKAYQVVNQARLKERWLSTLQTDHYANGEHVLRARDHAKTGRVMLLIDHYVPEPDRDAGSRTMIEFIQSLQADGWIIKFWPDNLRYDPVYTRQLQRIGVEVLYTPWVTSFDDWICAHRDDIDVVFLSRPTIARRYILSLEVYIPKTPRIFYGHDVHFARMKMEAALTRNSEIAEKADEMELLERALWKKFDLVLYPSQDEADLVKKLDSGVAARAVVPYRFTTFASRENPPCAPTLIFVAGFGHAPNIDAAIWFVKEILPLIRQDMPGVKLSLVGSNPTDKVRALCGANVEATGFVTEADLAERYATARVAVIPLRFGAGVKLKVVEAMRMGIPLVTTTVGCQGLPGLADIAPVFDEPDSFARACVELLQDEHIWRTQSTAQSKFARRFFSAEAMRVSLSGAIKSMAAPS